MKLSFDYFLAILLLPTRFKVYFRNQPYQADFVVEQFTNKLIVNHFKIYFGKKYNNH